MKLADAVGSLALFIGPLLLMAAPPVATAGWQKVYEARDKGLPGTAIEELKPLLADALQHQRHAEAVKAIAFRIAFEGQIEGGKAEENVIRLEAEIGKAPAEMRPVMEAILAHWYWAYFRQNRWRLMERTRTAEAPGQDLTTWDLPRILAEIDRRFTAALANERQLKATAIDDYDDLLEKGSVPDAYRPTLFDFLAHEALQFYQAAEQGGAWAEDEFEIDADSPVFCPVAAFLQWDPATTDALSPRLKALRLFRNLLAFHQADRDRSAFLDADLVRLNFARNQAVGMDRNVRFKEALQNFVAANPHHELSAQARFLWAQVLVEENEPAEARRIARVGQESFPASPGGLNCYNLIEQLQAKSASIAAERVWNAPWPAIKVTYRNVGKVYFRAVSCDFTAHVKTRRWQLWDLDDDQQRDLNARPAVKTWAADLPATTDLRERCEEVAAPQDLAPGFYYIVASHDELFRADNNQLSYAAVWVSDLALVVRQRHDTADIDGFVLQANGGTPASNAAVRMYQRDRNGAFRESRPVRTDDNGMFCFKAVGGEEYSSCFLVASQGGQELAGGREYGVYAHSTRAGPGEHTVFFTDRALYRPGQTIQYKGICYRVNTEKDDGRTLAGQEVSVVFSDPNGREVARAQVKCNDFGAFSGSFTAPDGRVTGQMTLRVVSGPPGSAHFNVEEYKRPKFQVEMEAPKEAARLGALVTMKGKASAYTGAAIGGAKVAWRVVRGIRFPEWCWWGRLYLPPACGGSQEIAHGTLTTGSDGSFAVQFTALPDLSIPERNEPVFPFEVYADVTDTAGETRSCSKRVQVGYTTLEASVSVGEWQTSDEPVEWTLASTSLDGEPQEAAGLLKVYALKQPETVMRAALEARHYDRYPMRAPSGSGHEPAPDPANVESWPMGDCVAEMPFTTGAEGKAKLATALKAGIYRAMLETKDLSGKPVTARRTVQVVDVKSSRYPVRMANYFVAQKGSVEPGETFRAVWGTGYDSGRAFVEMERNGKLLRSGWTGAGRTQEFIEQAVTENLRGGFSLRVTYVRENRAYLNERVIEVPWSNKKLMVKWEHFVSKLDPARKTNWTAVVTGPEARRCVAEMVAGLYDTSLDQYLPHDWMQAFNAFRTEGNRLSTAFENSLVSFGRINRSGGWNVDHKTVNWRYRSFPDDIMWSGQRNDFPGKLIRGARMMDAAWPQEAGAMEAAPGLAFASAPAAVMAGGEFPRERDGFGGRGAEKHAGAGGPAAPDLGKVEARRNLNETAFFFPHLVSDAEGVVKLEFTMPDAMTEWRFMGFAHDQELRSGFLTDKAVTSKDLMVEPNPPRFVREGDVIEFAVKVSNQSTARQTGRVRLTLADARTLEEVNSEFGIRNSEYAFDIAARESQAFSWRMSVPDGADFLTYKAVGTTDRLSDGEEGCLPVLSRRILVTESLPLSIRGEQTRKFDFSRLRESGRSKTLKSESLTVQMVSQPAWYAVMALPYLMEYPYECSEQIFSRLYANELAGMVANADPKIRRLFDMWKNTPALDSPLMRNQDLKSVMLEETPWLRQAHLEGEARRNLGILFDAGRLDDEARQTAVQLAQMQLSDGLWPWFPGFRGDEYISLYIATGFGRLRHLGATSLDLEPALKAMGALDLWIDRQYREILRQGNAEGNHLGPVAAFYLYGRSFFLKDRPIPEASKEAVDYFLGQGRKYWLALKCRQSQGHLAIALKRFGDQETPGAIMKSLREFSVNSEELGMFWRDTESSWWWYRAPIETQALMIEAFDEVAGDAQAVEGCKVWLLRQKQTQAWKTTKATADAVYGLLLRGRNLIASDALVEVSLGGVPVRPEKVEAGTGFHEKKFIRNEIRPAMGSITVRKGDEGIGLGSVHWQYFEDMAKVTPCAGTPLQLRKRLFIRESSGKGQVLRPVRGPLAVGDELLVRIELRVDRDMEYVHLKDQRASGTEPVNVLSQSRYQDGLMYYESTRDTASHFFIHYLPKGVYVFEYGVRIQLRGKYQTGMASIQCMYAPEFSSHSGSVEVEVE